MKAHETEAEVGVNHGPYNTLEETHTHEIQRHRFKRIEEQVQWDPHYPSGDNDKGNDEQKILLHKKP